jgi:outer membrane lipoprotein-sorting protein
MLLRSVLVALLFLPSGLAYGVEKTDQPAIRVDSVQADFVQEKQLPILARPIFSKGNFVFKAPGSLRWEYFSPIHTVLLMHDGYTRKFIKHDGKFREEYGMGVDAMQIILQEIIGWLDGEITDTPTFQARLEDGGRIILTPKEAALGEIISRIELKLLGQSGLMESVTLYEGEDSFTRMVFSNAVLNEKIAAGRFTKP